MAQYLPAVHSTLAAEPLVAAVWPGYPLGPPTACHLLHSGFSDHYFVSTPDRDYALRVSHHGWRSAEETAYELAALTHLEARGVPVCAPVARRDGTYQCTVRALEGPRIAVLFPFAPGRVPEAANQEENRACARTMGLIHSHTDGFTCQHPRPPLDLAHLIDGPLAAVLPFLARRPEEAGFVQSVASQLRAGLEARTGGLEWGYCHGDFHGGNARLDRDGTLRVFDFDCGGAGWRAYDLAICRLWCGTEEAAWDTFRAGYEEVRPFPAATLEAIPWFIVARQLWWIDLHLGAWSRQGGGLVVDDRFLDHVLGILHGRVDRYLPELAIP